MTGKAPVCDGGANCPSRAFPDLDPAQWYHLSTDYAITNHLFIGFEDGTFRPNGQMSRAMFAMVLWRVAGSPASSAALPFADVAPDAWYADAVRWAYANEVSVGVDDTHFAPDARLTRAQLVTMLYRVFGPEKGVRPRPIGGYEDWNTVPEWAFSATTWAVSMGLLYGTSSWELSPNDGASRAQLAAIIMRTCQLQGELDS